MNFGFIHLEKRNSTLLNFPNEILKRFEGIKGIISFAILAGENLWLCLPIQNTLPKFQSYRGSFVKSKFVYRNKSSQIYQKYGFSPPPNAVNLALIFIESEFNTTF